MTVFKTSGWNRSPHFVAVFCAAFALAIAFCYSNPNPSAPLPLSGSAGPSLKVVEQTGWLPRHEFQEFLDQKEAKGEDGKNFWDQGHCVGKIESRWQDGYQQFKIDIVQSPKDEGFSWMWMFDMSAEYFQKRIGPFSVEGYQLVSYCHNKTPSGLDSFSAVWHRRGKMGKAKHRSGREVPFRALE